MIKGTNWVGPYSRFSFDEAKNYLMVLKESGVPILDDEFNCLQEILLTYSRRIEKYTLGDGTGDDGYLCVGTGASNNFTIKAGTYFVDGWFLNLTSDITYSTQPIAQSALSTPVSNRTDYVYLDIWYDEIDTTEDSSIKDPTLNLDTSHRLKLYWAIKVAQGTTVPASYTDNVNNIYHWTHKIARCNRTATAAITAPMFLDERRKFFTTQTADVVGQVAFFAFNAVPAGWLVCDGSAVSRTTYADLFNKIGVVWGSGDGSTTFNIPKLNDGKFIRGWNNTGTGRDAGRVFGSTQNDDFRTHNHMSTFGDRNWMANPNSGRPQITPWGFGPYPYDAGCYGIHSDSQLNTDWDQGMPLTSVAMDVTTKAFIGNSVETRPYNYAMLGCIRYR